MVLKKDDEALWTYVPEGGGFGYAGPRVRLVTSPNREKRVTIAVQLKKGGEKQVNVSVDNLIEIGA